MIDAAVYGKALFDLAREEGSEKHIREELATVRRVLEDEPGYTALLDTPAVSVEEKLRLLRQSMEGADPMLLNFLCLLCEKRSTHQFFACAKAFDACYDEAHNILRATAITAVAMEESQQRALQKKLEAITGKTVILTNCTDESLIGGITLRCGGVQLEDSIRSRLDKLRRSLSETIV